MTNAPQMPDVIYAKSTDLDTRGVCDNFGQYNAAPAQGHTSYTLTSILEAERAAAKAREAELLAVISDFAEAWNADTGENPIVKHAAIIAQEHAAQGRK